MLQYYYGTESPIVCYKECMNLHIYEVMGCDLAEVISSEVVINTTQEALDIMADAYTQGARGLILHAYNLPEEFFDLRTGVAGEITQKFSTYRMTLAIVGDFSSYVSKSLQAYIRESNRGNQIFFVPDRETAIARLTAA